MGLLTGAIENAIAISNRDDSTDDELDAALSDIALRLAQLVEQIADDVHVIRESTVPKELHMAADLAPGEALQPPG